MKLLVYGASNVSRISLFLPDFVTCSSHHGYTSKELLKNEWGLSFLLSEDKYDKIFISAGANDTGSFFPHETRNNIIKLATQCGHIPFCILETPNSVVVNNYIQEDFSFVPFPLQNKGMYETDGIHLNEAGSLWVAQRILDASDLD
jgi:lysophospholipase L1-like esterase